MKKSLSPILLAGALVLVVSLALLYSVIYLMPSVMDEYYNPVFRSTSFGTDWLFYVHPLFSVFPFFGSGIASNHFSRARLSGELLK